jgi:hypothetical protein
VRARRGVVLLAGDAHSLAGFANTAFEHIAHAQFVRHLLHVNGLALVREARITGDDEEPRQARDRGRDFLDNAIHEIILFDIAGHILKGQHCQ